MLRSILIIFRELLNIKKAFKNIDGLLNTFIFVHKMLVNIIKFVWSDVELFQEMGRLWFYRFLQWFISGGCHFMFW